LAASAHDDTSSGGRSGAGGSSGGSPTKRRRLAGLTPPVNQDKLGSNAKIISLLEEMASIYKAAGDMMRSTAYTGAAAAVRSSTEPVTSGKAAAKALPGVGKASGDKIDEFLTTGTIKKLEEIRKKYVLVFQRYTFCITHTHTQTSSHVAAWPACRDCNMTAFRRLSTLVYVSCRERWFRY
jgi:hypothetical protein